MKEPQSLDDILDKVPENIRAYIKPIAAELEAMKRKRETILATARKQRKALKKLNTLNAKLISDGIDLDAHAILPSQHRQHERTAAENEVLRAKCAALEAELAACKSRLAPLSSSLS